MECWKVGDTANGRYSQPETDIEKLTSPEVRLELKPNLKLSANYDADYVID